MIELLPVLLLGVVAVAFAAGSISVSNLVGPRRPNPTKLGAYESGNEPLADVPGTRFSVKFYLVAMLFLIFDVEAVFVFSAETLPKLVGRTMVCHTGLQFTDIGTVSEYLRAGIDPLVWAVPSLGH